MAAVELTLVDHGHHGHDGYDCEEAVATAEAVTDDHCPDCALGLSCSECAMLTATRVAEIEVFQPVQSSSPTVLYTAIAPRRITHFDPPPPKVLTSI